MQVKAATAQAPRSMLSGVTIAFVIQPTAAPQPSPRTPRLDRNPVQNGCFIVPVSQPSGGFVRRDAVREPERRKQQSKFVRCSTPRGAAICMPPDTSAESKATWLPGTFRLGRYLVSLPFTTSVESVQEHDLPIAARNRADAPSRAARDGSCAIQLGTRWGIPCTCMCRYIP